MATSKWYIDKAADEIEQKLLDGAEEWLTADVKTEAELHCPVDQGTMRGTHTVQRSEREIVLGVGGPAAPYTRKQHEDASLTHNPGQEDHWLEKAFDRKQDTLPGKLQKRCKL